MLTRSDIQGVGAVGSLEDSQPFYNGWIWGIFDEAQFEVAAGVVVGDAFAGIGASVDGAGKNDFFSE